MKQALLASWCFDLPCINKKIETENRKKTIIENEFHKREERFGTLYYSKSRAPIFTHCFFIPSTSKKFVLSSPVRVDIDVTEKCNLNCIHCYRGKTARELDIELAKKIIDELKNMNVVGIQLLGGEPTIYPNIEELIEYSKRKGLKVELVTNGFKVTEKTPKTFSKIDSAIVSVDGLEKTHNKIRGNLHSFSEAIKTLEFFSRSNVHTSALMTLNRLNYREILEVEEIVKKSGANNLTVKVMVPLGNGEGMKKLCLDEKSKEEIKNFVRKKENIGDQLYPCLNNKGKFSFFGCPAGRFTIRIGADGNVYPCVYSDEIIGDLKKESFKKIWNRYSKNIFFGDSDCKFSSRCGGPCLLSKMSRNFNCELSNTN